MLVQRHDLHHEFPEYADKIHRMRLTDTRFAKFAAEYDKLDEEIRRLEMNGSLISDSEMEELKLRRIHLKDGIYAYLKKSS